MTEFISRTTKSFVVWRLAWLKASLMSGVAGGTVLVGALSGVQWSQFNSTEKFVLAVTVAINIANVIIAFLDKTIEKIESGSQTVQSTTIAKIP